jgi:flagellar hook-associated protein 3 FlgL
MRVTNKMLSHSFLSDMKTNLGNLQTLQQQMTSGKEIRKPSDDPARVARAMQLHTDINSNKQYKENISDTLNWLDTTDTALGQAGNVLQKVRELLVSAGNAAYGSSERKSIKDEVNQRIGEFAQIMNTSFDGKYIFGGTRGTEKPMSTQLNSDTNTVLIYSTGDSAEIAKIGQKLSVEISPGVTMDYNVPATDVMKYKNEKEEDSNIMELFKAIVNHLDEKPNTSTDVKYNDAAGTDPKTALIGKDLQGITDTINNILKKRAEVGAKQNRMESALEKNEDETFNMTSILSRTEDIDITQKTMEYATLQTVYMASLQTSARVLQPTLMDYLR